MHWNRNKFIFSVAIMLAAAAFLPGCATTCSRSTARSPDLPYVRIHGKKYVSLASLCDRRAIARTYDPLTRVITLTKANHQVRMALDDTFALIYGKPYHMRSPAILHEAEVYIPDDFRRSVLEGVFDSAPLIISDYVETPDFGKIKRVVIDAGHGGKDPGAIGRSGLYEKDVTLDIARRLNTLLRSSGLETVMVRSTDKFVSLEDRVKIANQPGNSLFISIHANANHSKK